MSLSPKMLEYHRRAYRRKISRDPGYWRSDARRLYRLKWARENTEKCRKSSNAWAARNPGYFSEYRRKQKLKMKARELFSAAVARGEIKRPDACSKCGAVCVAHGHHPDYSKPLEVIWLCYSCHLAEHGKEIRTPCSRIAQFI